MTKYLVIIFLFASSFAFGQNYHIEVQLKPYANEEIHLAHYYIGNIYLNDSLRLDNNGHGVFRGDSLLPQGLYKIYLNEKNHFDFLLGADQDFSLTNTSFDGQTLKVSGAPETEEFENYVVFLKGLKDKSSEIREKMKTASEAEKAELRDEMSKLTPALHNYWKNISEKYPDTFLAKFLMSNYVPELDVSTLQKEIQDNDSLLLIARFNYQKEHFWDYFDYTDERFLYTPLLKPKLETWFTKVLYQNYDSVKSCVINFIENTRPNKRIFQFVTSWFLNSSVNSNIMGMDALFVDLAKKYYLSGDAFWATEESMEKIKENLLFTENNLIGMTAPELNMESVDGDFISLNSIQAEYTMVLIFEPNCSHCKVFVPEFHDKVYEKYRDKGLDVYAIYSMDNKKEWVDFLTKHDLYDWTNVWDKNDVSRFKILYDARMTPAVYVLDKNKKIVAKKMTVEQLDNFFARELK
jgi:peroxiredoxin